MKTYPPKKLLSLLVIACLGAAPCTAASQDEPQNPKAASTATHKSLTLQIGAAGLFSYDDEDNVDDRYYACTQVPIRVKGFYEKGDYRFSADLDVGEFVWLGLRHAIKQIHLFEQCLAHCPKELLFTWRAHEAVTLCLGRSSNYIEHLDGIFLRFDLEQVGLGKAYVMGGLTLPIKERIVGEGTQPASLSDWFIKKPHIEVGYGAFKIHAGFDFLNDDGSSQKKTEFFNLRSLEIAYGMKGGHHVSGAYSSVGFTPFDGVQEIFHTDSLDTRKYTFNGLHLGCQHAVQLSYASPPMDKWGAQWRGGFRGVVNLTGYQKDSNVHVAEIAIPITVSVQLYQAKDPQKASLKQVALQVGCLPGLQLSANALLNDGESQGLQEDLKQFSTGKEAGRILDAAAKESLWTLARLSLYVQVKF